MVELKNVTKIFKDTHSHRQVVAVKDLNLSIEKGEFLTLLGPSGCGKTTTLRMIGGFEVPTKGSIYIEKQDVTSLPPNRRPTSMVFQSYALFPHMNVFDNIAYGLKIKKLSHDEIKKKVHEVLELVGLKGLEKRYPGKLSGGQQQRVALARALVIQPKVLLLDEPLSNLDAKLREQMRVELKKIQKNVGITFIYVTHDQLEAMTMSDRIVVMKDGIAMQIDTPEMIYRFPKNIFVANFIGKANLLEAEVKKVLEKEVEVILHGNYVVKSFVRDVSEWKEGDKVYLMVRPEGVEVTEKGNIKGIVKNRILTGALANLEVQVEDYVIQIEIQNPYAKKIPSIGEKIEMNFVEETMTIIRKEA